MPRVQTDTGAWIDISIIKPIQAVEESGRLDIDSRYVDPLAVSKGRPARKVGQREPRVKLYQGYKESTVPLSQVAHLLDQGFTVEPTRPTPPLKFACGVELLDSGNCHKMFLTERDRVQHIRRVHEDVAPWVLSEEDITRSQGKVVMSRASYMPDPRVGVLESKVKELIELLQKTAPAALAESIVDELETDLGVAETGAEEFMEIEDNIVPLKFPTAEKPVHNCKHKGAFGKYADGCPACDIKRAARKK